MPLEARNYTDAQFVRTYWREKVKRNDEHYPTTYNIYLSGNGLNSGKLEHIRTLEEAEQQLQVLVEDESTEWTYGTIYEVRPIVRRGTTYKKRKG